MDVSFAREYRPNTLNQYIGNEKLKNTVRETLNHDRRPQSILLEGSTGCGKTTMARLLVKEYSCEARNPLTGACGKCASCLEIDEYIRTGDNQALPDLQEIDIAEKSGKGEIDQVLEEAQYPAYGGGWKVYIFDECHMASPAAQNRMLKIVEEPPENVLMIFCTTDPQKMIPTLLNRCQLKLRVEKPGIKDLSKLLAGICKKESAEYDQEGLRTIATRADYIIRDSLNYLEQVLTSKGNAYAASVREEFNEVTDEIIFKFFDNYLEKDYPGYVETLFKIKTTVGFPMFLRSMRAFIARGIYIHNGMIDDALSTDEIESYGQLFQKFDIDQIALLLQKVQSLDEGNLEINLLAMMFNPAFNISSIEVSSTLSSSPDENIIRTKNIAEKKKRDLEEAHAFLESETEIISPTELGDMFNLIDVS